MIPGPPTSTLFPYTTLFRSVRLVGERADGQAGEFHRVLDSGLLERDVRHLANDRLRPVERGGIGKLGDRDEIPLVLARHEPRRHAREAENAEHHEAGVDGDRETSAAADALDERSVFP